MIQIEDIRNKCKDRTSLGEHWSHHYAVILPVIDLDDGKGPQILYEVRAQKLDRQPGEVCFPGGQIESGETPLEAALRETEELLRDPMSRAVVLGEIGLDYHYPDTDRKKQKELFDAQLSMSVRLGLPIAVHDRDAHGDVMDMLRAHPQAYGVLHSFSGSPEMAEELVRMGYYISFSGTLTFKNARRTIECAQCVPRERILIETDAPYLCPHPHRGELNHSGRLSYTCARLAELLGIREEEAAAFTADNAHRLFRL